MVNTQQSNGGPTIRRSGVKRIIQVLAGTFFQVAVLFIAAGRLDWAGAWIYAGLYIVSLMIFAVVLYKVNPELINQRGEKKSDTKGFDKVVTKIYTPLVILVPAVAGLDVRFGWSAMPFSFVGIGIALWIMASIITAWAMAVNVHFETTVRVQKDRDHKVCTRGPYQYVRHPGYVGIILMYVGTPLVLGSWWTFVPVVTAALLIIVRTALEDRTLYNELEGYTEYTRAVRYRMLPGVW